MRIWSIHPSYLDRAGLMALWREALLARAVLRGKTRGYRHHPQLERFRAAGAPVRAIDGYLAAVFDEAASRGYRFDRSKFRRVNHVAKIDVSTGQLLFEMSHLRRKVRRRDPRHTSVVSVEGEIRPHPLFRAVEGEIEPWERHTAFVTMRHSGGVPRQSRRL